MTERVADKQTEEGSPPGVLREHEISVEHPECRVLSTCPLCVFADRRTCRPDGEKQSRAGERHDSRLGEDARGVPRLAEMTRDGEARRDDSSRSNTLGTH